VNPCELLYSIKVPTPYPKKLKSERSTALTGNCNVIFQRRLAQKKKGLGSFNYIEKLFIKEARYGLSEDINSISSSLIRKIKRI